MSSAAFRIGTHFRVPKVLGTDIKPRGCLWLSVGDAWQEWVSNEMPEMYAKYRYKYVYGVDTDRLIVIDSMFKARRFAAAFGVKKLVYEQLHFASTEELLEDLRPKGLADKAKNFKGDFFDEYVIDWDLVREETQAHGIDGVLVIPDRHTYDDYEVQEKFAQMWYMGFDVPSAALWSTECIVREARQRNFRNPAK